MAEKEKNDGISEIQEAISKTELFIEKNKNTIIYVIVGIVLIACVAFLVNKYYIQPRNTDAQNQMLKGQEYFEADMFKEALNGDGKDFIGFAEIADEYSLTKSGNAANAYAAICNYKLGKYAEAIEFGKEFDGNDDINLSVVINGLIGDSYVNLNQYSDAHKYFAKAYETNNEAFAALYLKKDGEVYEAEKNFDKAIELYNKIKNEYPQSGEAQDIEKYIERATLSK